MTEYFLSNRITMHFFHPLGFILPPEQIVPSALEFIDGVKVLAGDLKKQLDAEK